MKRILMIAFFVSISLLLFCTENSQKNIIRMEFISLTFNDSYLPKNSINDNIQLLHFMSFSNSFDQYKVIDEKAANFVSSRTSIIDFYNVILDSIAIKKVNNYLNNIDNKVEKRDEVESLLLCLISYDDKSVDYINFNKDYMSINGNQLPIDIELLSVFIPYLPKYHVKSIQSYFDVEINIDDLNAQYSGHNIFLESRKIDKISIFYVQNHDSFTQEQCYSMLLDILNNDSNDKFTDYKPYPNELNNFNNAKVSQNNFFYNEVFEENVLQKVERILKESDNKTNARSDNFTETRIFLFIEFSDLSIEKIVYNYDEMYINSSLVEFDYSLLFDILPYFPENFRDSYINRFRLEEIKDNIK